MKLLIDGDVYLYRHCSAIETIFTWEEDLHTLVSDSREARQKMEIDLAGLQKKLEAWLKGPLDLIIAFSDSENWRKILYPPYKAHRLGLRKPIAYRPVKDWFIKNYPCRIVKGLEADDVLGILSTSDPDDCIIVSIDKDLRTIPGFLYNPDNDDHPKLISLQAADWFHMYQTLMGDLVDGYPGCPRIGPVKASKALGLIGSADGPEMWERVIRLYKRSGVSLEDATIQAKVARILRNGEWDFDKKECLWVPPKSV